MYELIFDAILSVVLLFFFLAGQQIPELSSAGDFVEAKGFPMMFAAIALVLLAADILRLTRELSAAKRNGEGQAAPAVDLPGLAKVALIMVLTVAYIALVKTAGFVLLSILFTFAALNILRSKNQLFNALFSILAVLVLALIFGRFFGIALPRGAGILKALSFYLY